jgi:hypothetical protein
MQTFSGFSSVAKKTDTRHAIQEERMNQWKEFDDASLYGVINVELFDKLLELAKDAENSRQDLSRKIDRATNILNSA